MTQRATFCRYVFAAALALLPVAATAMVVCVEDEPFLPMSNAGLEPPGHGQILIREVVRKQGVPLRIVLAPWKRCQALVAAGTYDATLAAAYAGRNIELLAFPMRAPGIPDGAKATGSATTYLYRRKGTPADYVNGRFVRLSGPVGVTSGFQASTETVLKGGGQVYDGAKSADQLAKMLLAGRLELVAAEQAFVILAREKYRDELEALQAILHETDYYLAFSPAFYKAQRELVEKVWSEMATVRHSAAYMELLSRLRY